MGGANSLRMDYDEPLFFRVMRYAARADRDVIDMVSGNPDWEPPEALRTGLGEYAEAPTERFQYPPSAGLRELREEIAARRNVDPEQVVVRPPRPRSTARVPFGGGRGV